MARRFRRRETGAWFPERYYAAFRGTVRYASLGVHERLEQVCLFFLQKILPDIFYLKGFFLFNLQYNFFYEDLALYSCIL